MADLNDVVRHVILRIIVDQKGLAEELAAARAKLKGLKDAEKDINKERGKSSDEVTKAIKAQNDALGENQRAHEAAQRSAAGKSNKAADAVKAETEAIKANTKERESQTVAEAKARDIDKRSRQGELDAIKARSQAAAKAEQDLATRAAKAHQDELDRRAKRSAATKLDLQSLLQEAEKTQQAIEKTQQAAEKTASAAIGNDNNRLGGRNDRRIRTTESAAKVTRANQESQEKRDRALAEFNENERRKDDKHDQDARNKDTVHNENERRKNQAAANTAANRKTESDARKATTDARTQGVNTKNTDADNLLKSTYDDRQTAIKQTAQGKTVVAQQRAEGATSIAEGQQARAEAAKNKTISDAEIAASKTQAAANKTASDAKLAASKNQAAEEKRIGDQQTRQVRNQSLLANLKTAASKAATGQAILEERLGATAEARARAAEREAKAARGRRGLVSTAGAVVADSAVVGLRSIFSAPRKAIDAKAPDLNSEQESLRKITTLAGRAEHALGGFFGRFTSDGDKAANAMGGLRAKFTAFIQDLDRPRKGGSGGSLISDLVGNFTQLGEKLTGSLSSARSHIFSFQTVILAAVAALGPLAATLGAVGAAALGLASNIGALSGALFALPGILGALVGGFGALALVMKPVTSVFSAYTAAQKEATKATEAAKTSALALQEAQLNEKEAHLAYTRAIEDEPRAQRKLSDARKQAARDIQDYRLQLQKLKFDEEGASLGVESAELAYRKALVDPTQTNLDRRIARHDVEGALFDKRDQDVAGGRLKQDSSEAFKKGVEGSDAVIEAQRGVVDATNDVTASYINWQQAILATKKAALEDKAGGAAAAEYQKEIDKLPPKTKKVVLALIALKDAYKSMRDRLSENIFGPISGETGKFKDVLKSLESFLTPISVAIGTFAKKALDLFTNPEWKKFFSTQGEESGHIIEKLGDALLSAANGFKTIVEVAQPFTRFVVDGIAAAAKGFDDFYNSTELLNTGLTKGEANRGKLAGFLDLTKQRIKELWPVVKNLASGFAGFFAGLNTAGGGQKDFTSWFNDGLLNASKTFKKLGDAARDPNGGFQKWLRDVRPLLSQVATFIGQVFTFAGRMFSDTKNMAEAKAILQQIGQKWLPAIADIFSKLSESGFISKLAAGISSVFTGINDFFDNGGLSALSTFSTILKATGDVIGGLIGFVDKLAAAVPLLGAAFKGVGVIIGLFFGAALLSRLSGLIPGIIGIAKAVRGTANVLGSVLDPNRERRQTRRTRIKESLQDRTDAYKDKVFDRNSGESAARRNERNIAKGKPGRNVPASTTPAGTPQLGSRTNTGNVLTTLYRIEKWVEQVAVNTRGGGAAGRGTGAGGVDVDPDGKPRTGPKGGTGSPGGLPAKPKYTVPDLDPRAAGFGVVGADVVAGGVDPNSAEGKKQRKEAAQAAKQARLARDSTPLSRLDSTAATKIADDIESRKPARVPRRTRIKGKFGGLGSALLQGLGVLGGGAAVLPSALPGEKVVPSLGALNGPQSYLPGKQVAASYNGPNQGIASPLPDYQQVPGKAPKGAAPIGPYNYPSGAAVLDDIATPITGPSQNVPQAAQQRGPNGRFLPRPTTQYPYDPYDINPTVQPPSQNIAQAPQQRGPNGRFLPRPTGSFNPYDLTGSAGMPAAPSAGLYQGPQRPPTGFTGANPGFSPIDIDAVGAPAKGPGRARRLLNRITGKVANQEGYLDLGTSRGRFDLSGDGSLLGADEDDDDGRSRRRGLNLDLPDVESPQSRRGLGEVEPERPARGGRLGRASRGLGRGLGRGGRGAGRGLSSIVRGAGRGLGGLGKGLGGLTKGLGGLGKLGGGLLKGAAGGLGGLAASLALSFGGDALINKFVKNDDDANSLSGGLSNVATGAGLGAMFGGPVGAALGGLAGGAYSLATDKNLRSFVGDKVKGGAKAVGGFVKGAASKVSGFVGNLFGGGDDEDGKKPSGIGGAIKGGLKGFAAGGLVGGALGALGGTDIGKSILDSLKKATGGVRDFFTKTIPGFFHKGIQSITDFFTKTLPGLPKKAINGVAAFVGYMVGFFTERLPRIAGEAWKGITGFFTETLPAAAEAAWKGITGFFTETLPAAASAAWKGITGFFTETLPAAADAVWSSITGFFTETLPNAAEAAWKGIKGFFTETLPEVFDTVKDKISTFFGTTLPEFFTVTLPNAIKSLPGFLYDNLVQPILDFFKGIGGHVGDFLKGSWDWVKGLFSGVGDSYNAGKDAGGGTTPGHMSGGLIAGVYQGIQDTAHIMATPGEFMVRKGRVDEPGAKAFLRDFNEHGMASLYSGLSASTAPQVMSMIPPDAQALTGKVPSVVNTTINHAPVMGDVTIHNPVRERSEHSLRRQVQIANIRHRR